MTALPVGFNDAQDRETSAANGPANQRAKQNVRKSARKVGSEVGQQVGQKVHQFLDHEHCAPAITPPRNLPLHRMFVIWMSPD